jgi:transposase
MAMAEISIEVDLPPDVTLTSYQRYGDGHGFEVRWPLPDRCRCERCRHEADARIEFKNTVLAIRDLDVWGQPSFFVYQPPFHRCPRCGYRQDFIPPFKRKDVAYTYRFEEHVLRSLIGSNEEEVARRLGTSAETVGRILRNQLADSKPIDPGRVISDVGLDELSLKKGHKLYATLLTDLSDPQRPRVLAVARGRDEKAGRECLGRLTAEQRAAVKTYRVDMGPAYNAAASDLLKDAKPVIDRFHVAKKFNEVVDAWRKKNHARLQGEVDQGPAEGIPLVDVGVPPRPQGPEPRGEGEAGGLVRPVAAVGEAVPGAGGVQAHL